MEDVVVVNPDSILILPPLPSLPAPTVMCMLPPVPDFGVHGRGFPMCASPLEILMSPEAPSDDIPVRSVSDPVSPLSPAFDVAITNIHGTASSEQVTDSSYVHVSEVLAHYLIKTFCINTLQYTHLFRR